MACYAVSYRQATPKRDDLTHINGVYTNIRGLQANWLELKNSIINLSPHIIGVTETFLKSDDIPFELNGYNSFSNSRTVRGGGGVAIFVRDTIMATEERRLNDL